MATGGRVLNFTQLDSHLDQQGAYFTNLIDMSSFQDLSECDKSYSQDKSPVSEIEVSHALSGTRYFLG